MDDCGLDALNDEQRLAVEATDAKDPICQVRFDRLATTRWLSSAALRTARAGAGDLV